jgi:hypothetical protein
MIAKTIDRKSKAANAASENGLKSVPMPALAARGVT